MRNYTRQMLSCKCSLFIAKFSKKNARFPVFIFHTFREFKKIQIFFMISIFCNIFQEKWKMCKTNLCKNCAICFLLLQAFHRSIKCWNPPTVTCKYVKIFYDISKLWSTFFAFVIFTDINIWIFFLDAQVKDNPAEFLIF